MLLARIFIVFVDLIHYPIESLLQLLQVLLAHVPILSPHHYLLLSLQEHIAARVLPNLRVNFAL